MKPIDGLFNGNQFSSITEIIACEFANRNLFALIDFSRALENSEDDLGKRCLHLFSSVKELVSDESNLKSLINCEPKPRWIDTAIWLGKTNDNYDLDNITLYICIGLIQQKQKHLDDYVQNLSNTTLLNELDIQADDDFLVDISDSRFELKNHGIIFNKSIIIYPHQFFRRYYSSNFVEMPSLLRKSQELGLKVSIRLDPLRKTTVNHYREIIELDHWYGFFFSKQLLNDTKTNARTVHYSRCASNLVYDVKFTVFRTKMMDASIREFTIEEYCPLISEFNENTPGVDERYCIQKFAHFCYDQKKGQFYHLDGAIRVFKKEEYIDYFKKIETGDDVNEKIGDRYKMFLIEGRLSQDIVQEL
jgi:hypothetical protein